MCLRRKLRCLALSASALLLLSACSPRQYLLRQASGEIASQAHATEEDLGLAKDAGAFYLKLSEALLRQDPGNAKLAESVAAGFTQYAYAFLACEADRIEARSPTEAQALRERAARMYARAKRHAMAMLEQQTPGLSAALDSAGSASKSNTALRVKPDQVGLAYWAAAAWGGQISLSKDSPEIVAQLPAAMRLAQLAYDAEASYGAGALASLTGLFEASRPGGSATSALPYFDQAIAFAGQQAGPALLAKAEGHALPAQDRAGFEALLRQAIAATQGRLDLPSQVARERAQWLLSQAADLF
nr:TRAP transporter TatT component family protein [uncultured Roseateles sp.]